MRRFVSLDGLRDWAFDDEYEGSKGGNASCNDEDEDFIPRTKRGVNKYALKAAGFEQEVGWETTYAFQIQRSTVSPVVKL